MANRRNALFKQRKKILKNTLIIWVFLYQQLYTHKKNRHFLVSIFDLLFDNFSNNT